MIEIVNRMVRSVMTDLCIEDYGLEIKALVPVVIKGKIDVKPSGSKYGVLAMVVVPSETDLSRVLIDKFISTVAKDHYILLHPLAVDMAVSGCYRVRFVKAVLGSDYPLTVDILSTHYTQAFTEKLSMLTIEFNRVIPQAAIGTDL